MNYRKAIFAALIMPLVSLTGGALSSAHAAGYAVFTHGASALGQGNAVTAHTQSPSTIFYNPALMNKLEGTQLEVGTTAIIATRDFTSAADGTSTSNSSTFFPSTFYVTHKFNDKLSAGFGVFNPFGLGTEWNSDWEGKNIATKSELTTFNLNPVVSYRVLPQLAIAAGLDVILLDATLQRKLPSELLADLGFPGGVDINQKFKGDGTGVGYNVAIAYDPTPDVTVGVSYRSEVEVDVKGKATFTSALPAVFNDALNSGGKTTITLPRQLTAAVAYRGIDRLTLEAGLRWEGWSSFDRLLINLDNGSSSETPRDWHDSFGLNLGGRYQVNDGVGILAGYVLGNTAVPDSTFDPSIPDAKTHVFCVGSDLKFQRFKLALAYAYQLYENRTKNNAIDGGLPPQLPADRRQPANGKYESDAHLLAVSLGYQF